MFLSNKANVLSVQLFKQIRHISSVNSNEPALKSYPGDVTIVEVGPRDGLQNEKIQVDTQKKIEFVDRLSETGLKRIEVTSFVSPKWVPQLADSMTVMNAIKRNPHVRYSTLTPNLKGFQNALKVNTQEVAIFGAASETFSKKNINCSIADSLRLFDEVVKEAKKNNIPIRGYVSCIVGCPYEGEIKPLQVTKVVEKLLEMGCYEVSLGDTVGVGNPNSMNVLMRELNRCVSGKMDLLGIHCHDTYGMALVNILQALEHGIKVIDSSCAGLGGCPYAKGASGNVATEDVVYLLDSLGVKTGVDLTKILETSEFILRELGGRSTLSKVAMAFKARKM